MKKNLKYLVDINDLILFDSDGSIIDTGKIENYNKNHDGSGRFSSGPGDSGSKVVDLSTMSDDKRIDYLMNSMSANYTEDEIYACNKYTSMTWAESINKYYRTDNADNLNNELHGITVDDIKEHANLINSAAKKSPLKESMYLYRVTDHMPANLKLGDIYTDKGFGSTSAVDGLFKYDYMVHRVKIKAKKGTPIVNMSAVTKSLYGTVDNQAEIVMALNTSYRVTSIDGKNIELEVI